MKYFSIKRFFDIIFSIIALILLSPFFVIIIFFLRFTGEGEVFYFQERLGLKNKKFWMIKFATMLKNSINMGSGSITLKDDFRVTFFGKFLRKTKINELPQIINIIKGDISIVGPRPLVPQTFESYSPEIQKKIYNVRPGLTGIGSLIFRDEETIISENFDQNPHKFYKNHIAPHKGNVEIWYQKNISFYVDLKIIILTAISVLFPKNKFYKRCFKKLPKNSLF